LVAYAAFFLVKSVHFFPPGDTRTHYFTVYLYEGLVSLVFIIYGGGFCRHIFPSTGLNEYAVACLPVPRA
jgi:hypothetical protein